MPQLPGVSLGSCFSMHLFRNMWQIISKNDLNVANVTEKQEYL
jgi:hypothetical protein